MPEPEAVLSHRRETTAGRSAVGTHPAAPGSAGGAGTLGVDVKVAEPRVPGRGLVPGAPQEQTRYSDTPVGRHVTLRRDTPTSRVTLCELCGGHGGTLVFQRAESSGYAGQQVVVSDGRSHHAEDCP